VKVCLQDGHESEQRHIGEGRRRVEQIADLRDHAGVLLRPTNAFGCRLVGEKLVRSCRFNNNRQKLSRGVMLHGHSGLRAAKQPSQKWSMRAPSLAGYFDRLVPRSQPIPDNSSWNYSGAINIVPAIHDRSILDAAYCLVDRIPYDASPPPVAKNRNA